MSRAKDTDEVDVQEAVDQSDETHVGDRTPRREDHDILTGKQEYVHDRNPPEALHAAFVRSPHPHARVLNIDVSEAEAHHGCEFVLTKERYADNGFGPTPGGIIGWEEWPLADEKVRYVGECVAMVLGTDRYAAEDAAELVEVEYEPLEPVVEMMDAREDDTVLYEEHSTNVAFSEDLTFGEFDEEFENADNVIEEEYTWRGRASGVPLETPGVIAEYSSEEDGTVFDIFATQQSPYSIVGPILSDALGVAEEDIHFEVPHTLGGSFGTKCTSAIRYTILAAAAAKLTEKPVKYVEDRVEDLQAGDASSTERKYTMKLAVDDDGAFRAVNISFVDDQGAFPRAPATSQATKPMAAVTGPYDVQHLRYSYDLVVTNKQIQSAYRGFGIPAQSFAWEMVVDKAAKQLDLDPVELRHQNYIESDQMPYQLPTKNIYDSGDYPAILTQLWEQTLEKEQDDGLLDPERIEKLRQEGIYRGAAPTVICDPGVGNQEHQGRQLVPDEVMKSLGDHRDSSDILHIPEPVEIEVRSDGKVAVRTSNESAGQAHDTVVTQLMADELGISPEDVIPKSGLDKHEIPANLGPISSRTAVMLSDAVIGGCEKLRSELEMLAAEVWECDVKDVTYSDGGVKSISTDDFLSLQELNRTETRGSGGIKVTPIRSKRRTIVDYEADHPGVRNWDLFKEAFQNKLPGYPTTSISANMPIVDVDIETGEITLQKIYSIRDAGTILNPDVIDGQYHGGIAQGIGAALQEEFAYTDEGNPRTNTLFDMKIPSIKNIPEIEIDHSETPSPFTKSGAKGAGESGMMDIPASIASSVNAALAPLDVHVTEIPLSSDRVHEMIRQ